MPRVKHRVTAQARRKEVVKQAEGSREAKSRVFRVAKQAVTRASE